MKPELLRLIKESRDLIKHATPQQQLRFLKLIKESMRVQHKTVVETKLPENSDYLEEK